MKPITPERYAALRNRIGSRTEVAELLGVDLSTISRRERGTGLITWESWLALRYLAAKPKKAKK